MVDKPITKVTKATCPDCGEDFSFAGQVSLGRLLTCPNCDAELEIIETDPVELDWAYDDDYDDDDNDEDDDNW